MTMESTISSPVRDFYRGKSVFITGATGFLAKVLVEKLLRTCVDVKSIYILLRAKRGQDVRRRMEVLLSSKLFDVVKAENPSALDKIIPIEGDIGLPELGISASDREKLCESVSIVFHSAANLRYDGPLKEAVNMNTLGTIRMIELSERMKHLEAFVFISSISAFCHKRVIEEKIYPLSTKPEKAIDCIQWMDDDMVETLKPKLLGDHDTSYPYSKALTEHIVMKKEVTSFPAVIVRPGLVTPTYREPFPGWIDSGVGITDILVGVGKGLFRTCHCIPAVNIPMDPCDYAINKIICIAWKTATERESSIKIYNSAAGTANPINWERLYVHVKYHGHNNPIRGMFWYPDCSLRSNYFENKIADFFLHYIPALLIQYIAIIMGKKSEQPLTGGVRAKSWGLTRVLSFYYKSQKQARDMRAFMLEDLFSHTDYTNTVKLQEQLSPEDRKTFPFDVEDIEWSEYISIFIQGGRRYYLKQDPSTIPMERKNLQKLFYAHMLLQMFLFFCFMWLIYNVVLFVF